MDEQKQASFDGWAIVEVMGHQRYAGYVTTEAYGAAVLFRVDVPALEERERVTVRPSYVNSEHCPAGSRIKEGAVQGYSKLVGSGSIYCITPCTKEAALKAVESLQPRPLMLVALPEEKALPAAAGPADERKFECCGGNPEDGHNLDCSSFDEGGDADDDDVKL